MTLHLGFTGTQAGMTYAQAERLFDLVRSDPTASSIGFIGHHGLCIGADLQFDAIARLAPNCLGIVVHPCNIPTKQGRVPVDVTRDAVRPVKKPLVRNRDIVTESGIMVATPKEAQRQLRSGTWTTVRYALEAGKPVAIILPDGGCVFDGPAWPWLP